MCECNIELEKCHLKFISSSNGREDDYDEKVNDTEKYFMELQRTNKVWYSNLIKCEMTDNIESFRVKEKAI